MNFRILITATLLLGTTTNNIRPASPSVTRKDPGLERRDAATEALCSKPIQLPPCLIGIVNSYIRASKYMSRTWQMLPGKGIVETRKRYDGACVPKTIITEKEMACLSNATVQIIISPRRKVLLFAAQKNKDTSREVYVGHIILRHPTLRYGVLREQFNRYHLSVNKMISAMSFKAIKDKNGNWQTGIWHEEVGPIKVPGGYSLKFLKDKADYHSETLIAQAHQHLSEGDSLESVPYFREQLKAKTIKQIMRDNNNKK